LDYDDDQDDYSVDLLMDDSWNDDKEDDRPEDLERCDEPQHPEEGVYHMSGAGTQIYMGVEVFLNSCYNLKTDVYAWSMTVAEMFLLESPLPVYSMEEHIQYICREGDRPVLDTLAEEVPESLKELLEWAWTGDVSQRCSMAQVCEELEMILVQVKDKEKKRTTQSSLVKYVSAFSFNIRYIARSMKNLVWNAMAETFQNLCVFFRSNNAAASSDELVPPRGTTTTAILGETAPSNQENKGIKDDSVCGSKRLNDSRTTEPASQQQYARRDYSRKASSASSTMATTDDECECDFDDNLLISAAPAPAAGNSGNSHLTSFDVVAEQR